MAIYSFRKTSSIITLIDLLIIIITSLPLAQEVVSPALAPSPVIIIIVNIPLNNPEVRTPARLRHFHQEDGLDYTAQVARLRGHSKT